MRHSNPAPDRGIPFPSACDDIWEALDGSTAEALRALREELISRREEMDLREPDPADEENYDAWAEAHEELEDLIDEITDRLEG